jgi:hypothetical protein
VAEAEPPNFAPTAKARESLSQFVARVLDQLSISAWLPAGALVGIVLLFGELRANHGDLGRALKGIGGLRAGSLVLLLVAVVLGTMMTQAFEFEAIRLLEGYWGTGPIGRRAADLGISWHTWHRDRLNRRYDRLNDDAFAAARQAMLRRNVAMDVVDVLERERAGASIEAYEASVIDTAHSLGWKPFGAPNKVRWLEDLESRLDDYPLADYRVLPTRLGNVVRAAEDRAFPDRSRLLETSVIEVFNDLPAAIQTEHDQDRSRLELYCSMVVVFGVSALGAYPILHRFNWEVPAGLVVLSGALSYRAAVASGRKYGRILEAIAATTSGRPGPSEYGAQDTSGPWSRAASLRRRRGTSTSGLWKKIFRGPRGLPQG